MAWIASGCRRGGVWALLALALAGSCPGADAPDPAADAAADAERARDLEEVRVLRDKARARGEPVLWADFVRPATPAAMAAAEIFNAWSDRRENEQGKLDEEGKAAQEFFDCSVPVEHYRVRLAALPRSPLVYGAGTYAGLDRILAGPAPAFALDPDTTDPFGMQLSHLQRIRAAFRMTAARARILAVEQNGDAALAALERDFALLDWFEDDPTLIASLVRIAVRSILCSAVNDVCLLDPPSPAALRRMAARIESLPPAEAWIRHGIAFERAQFERFFFLDADWRLLNPMTSESATEMTGGIKGIKEKLPEKAGREYGAEFWRWLRTVPALWPERNVRQVYREYDELLGDDVDKAEEHQERLEVRMKAAHGELRAIEDAAAKAGAEPDYAAIGAGKPEMALVAYEMVPSIGRAFLMARRETVSRKALVYTLNLLAERLEGKPYSLDNLPINELTGQSYETERADGTLTIYIWERRMKFRLPLAPGDEGYDRAQPWRYGFAPAPGPDEKPAAAPPPENEPLEQAHPEVF